MKIGEIAGAVQCIKLIGNPEQDVSGVIPLPPQNSDASLLFWCSEKNLPKLKGISRGNIICGESLQEADVVPGCNYVVVLNPRQAFQKVLASYFQEPCEIDGIATSAKISHSAKVNSTAIIGENVVLEAGVVVGARSIVGHNTVIKRRTIVGEAVVIGSNCSIGGVGFGYEKDEHGEYRLLPHIGNVIIEDGVEIGNNTAIDRAVLGSTIIKKNAKIDNLVHIAHGVEIGENSLIIANAMIAGSVSIGKNVWVAPSASVLNQKKVNDGAVIGMGAVVLKDVKDGETIIGNPGKVLVR